MTDTTSDIRHKSGSAGPVRLDDWLAANQPKLHPTRRKVLQTVVELAQGQDWANSREVRELAGLSQQLLNRHLRALEADGLVRLENPGPGLPLNVAATAAGQRAIDLRAPARQRNTDPAVDPIEPLEPAAPPETEAVAAKPSDGPSLDTLSGQLHRLLSQRYPDLNPDDLERLVAKAARLAQERKAVVAPVQPPTSRAPRPEAPAPVPPAAPPRAVNGGLSDLTRRGAGHEDAWFRPTGDYPPPLNQAETALESRLQASVNQEYQGLAWYQRTRLFSDTWERLRRRRLGLLTNYFTNFQPRWERSDWVDFNQGRRQADARGADYREWIQAVTDAAEQAGEMDLQPQNLHGKAATAAYQAQHQSSTQQARSILSEPAPYTPETFDLANPEHTAYAEALMEEIASLAQAIYGDDQEGPLRLAIEAVNRGNLPLRALDLRPRWKEQALNALARMQPAGRAATSPPPRPAPEQGPQAEQTAEPAPAAPQAGGQPYYGIII